MKKLKNEKEYMKKSVENMKEYYVKNIKKYEENNMWPREIEERGASRYEYFSPYIQALDFGIIPSSPHIGSRTWKKCDLYPLYLYRL